MNAFFAVDIKERTENLKLAEKKNKKERTYVLFYLLAALLK
jgi:hypothetical protein